MSSERTERLAAHFRNAANNKAKSERNAPSDVSVADCWACSTKTFGGLCTSCLSFIADRLESVESDGDGTKGFSLWLSREEWGAVMDGLILEQSRSAQRKSVNLESTSEVRAAMCDALIIRIGNKAVGTATEARL